MAKSAKLLSWFCASKITDCIEHEMFIDLLPLPKLIKQSLQADFMKFHSWSLEFNWINLKGKKICTTCFYTQFNREITTRNELIYHHIHVNKIAEMKQMHLCDQCQATLCTLQVYV